MEDNKMNETYDRMPMIGDPAPEFRAITTMGKVDFPADYKGSWVVLFHTPQTSLRYAPRNSSASRRWLRNSLN